MAVLDAGGLPEESARPDSAPPAAPDSTSWAAGFIARRRVAVTLDAARRGVPTVTTDGRPAGEHVNRARSRRPGLETRRRVTKEGDRGDQRGLREGDEREDWDGTAPYMSPSPSPSPSPKCPRPPKRPAPNVPAPDGFEAPAADAALASPGSAVTDARGVLNLLRGVGDDPSRSALLLSADSEACPSGPRAAPRLRYDGHAVVIGKRVEGDEKDEEAVEGDEKDASGKDASNDEPSTVRIPRRVGGAVRRRRRRLAWALHPPAPDTGNAQCGHPTLPERCRRARLVADAAARLAAAFADDPHADPAEDAAARATARDAAPTRRDAATTRCGRPPGPRRGGTAQRRSRVRT